MISASGRGGAFFLTSLFVELIDRVLSAIARSQQLLATGRFEDCRSLLKSYQPFAFVKSPQSSYAETAWKCLSLVSRIQFHLATQVGRIAGHQLERAVREFVVV